MKKVVENIIKDDVRLSDLSLPADLKGLLYLNVRGYAEKLEVC